MPASPLSRWAVGDCCGRCGEPSCEPRICLTIEDARILLVRNQDGSYTVYQQACPPPEEE